MREITEHQIQVAFIKWVSFAKKQDWRLRLLFAVPNGGARSAATAAILQREGVLPGVCDIIFPYPAAGFCGMAIEFKHPKTGRLSEQQAVYIDLLTRAGWLVVVITDAHDAIRVVRDYLRDDALFLTKGK